MYINEQFSYEDLFDQYILNYIESTGKHIDKENRIVEISIDQELKQYELHDIKWVTNNKQLSKARIKQIDSQY